MTWFLVVMLGLVAVLAMLAVGVLLSFLEDEKRLEKQRVDLSVLHAERRLHDLARNGLESMLAEARAHDQAVK